MGLLMMGSLIPVLAATEWPVKEGDKLNYDVVWEYSYDEEGYVGNGYFKITGKFVIEILEVDNDEIKYSLVIEDKEIELDFDDNDFEDAMEEELEDMMDDIEDSSEIVEDALILMDDVPFIFGSDLWEDFLDFLDDAEDTDEDYYADLESAYENNDYTNINVDYTSEVDGTSYSYTEDISYTDPYSDYGRIDFDRTVDFLIKMTDDGVLEEYLFQNEQKVVGDDVSDNWEETLLMSVKKSGLIPGYSLSWLLGIFASSLMGYIYLMKKRMH